LAYLGKSCVIFGVCGEELLYNSPVIVGYMCRTGCDIFGKKVTSEEENKIRQICIQFPVVVVKIV